MSLGMGQKLRPFTDTHVFNEKHALKRSLALGCYALGMSIVFMFVTSLFLQYIVA
jgi:hypothetical protein